MMWIEMVFLRSDQTALEEAERSLAQWIEESALDSDIDGIQLLQQYPEIGDFMVAIRWNSDRVPERTRVGYAINRFLEKYGSTKHTTWILTHSILRSRKE
ncbi:hypothetical protein JXA80_11005 [bacterium]|nr:hypothetical protein [candidate division CSSED10-310 bacterium]